MDRNFNKPFLEVVAALIWEEDRFLICRRPAHKARGLLWEFVGGKVESGESKAQAVVRECREELDISVQPGSIFCEVEHEYEDVTVHLTLFNCTIVGGEPTLLEHNDMRWITVEEIPSFDFCPADTEILALLCGKR
ncbi:MAG: (deoxy)nucleoside triphosphate pyrophosphohydrolase [Candidatus Coproplasma sp.]